ncbi:TetR/AcrR family transcriptional regulator [Corynebacterium sp.]|uniref:TetR/AcrR family transcriptional regulator n=1 Tax=Corynebacterium sp. TaxID=1720 RepID=UPI003735B25E
MSSTPNRQARRRAETRAKLLKSAYSLLSEKGGADTTVADITAGADVGTGTFYNHFSSREEIFQTTAEESLEKVGQSLDVSVSRLHDPAEVWSASLRYLVRYALSERVWGWFFVNMGAAHPALMSTFGPRAHRDLSRGVKEGRMMIDDIDVAVVCAFGALYGTIQKGLTMDSHQSLDSTFARAMLRMVGVSADEAQQIAALPLPELSISTLEFQNTE